MNMNTLATTLVLIGTIIFGALSLFYIIKLSIFTLRMNKHDIVSEERWTANQRKPLLIYFVFVFFVILNKISN